MVLVANAGIAVLGYGQLHSAAAGAAGTSNLCSSARQPATWTSPTGPGNFGLAAPIVFAGGGANNPVYSVTLWSLVTGGVFYGEFPLTAGDTQFNGSGGYTVTALDETGIAT
jgi:hypothetical protein